MIFIRLHILSLTNKVLYQLWYMHLLYCSRCARLTLAFCNRIKSYMWHTGQVPVRGNSQGKFRVLS